MTIRRVQAHDLPALYDMVQALTAHHNDTGQITQETLARDVLGDHPWVHILVAEFDGALVGYVAMIPLARFHDGLRSMDIHNLYLVPDQRGKGFGRALIDASVAYARARQCQIVWVGTAPDNTDAQDMYLHYGFQRFDATNPRFRLDLT